MTSGLPPPNHAITVPQISTCIGRVCFINLGSLALYGVGHARVRIPHKNLSAAVLI
jgi:hypothetical protein